MDYEIAAPRAGALVESLRGFGYSTGAAIADLVDNSISAGARNIWLDCRFDGPSSCIALLDDGVGMTEPELRNAMILGARNPRDARGSEDLGRFGLGLKTASFSQCRCLTVASRRNGVTTVRRWDLDYIANSPGDEWRLLMGPRPGSGHLLGALDEQSSGTVVVWEALDRITAGMLAGDRRSEDAFFQVIEHVERHLAMVFHQFLDGKDPVRLFINGRRIKAWDPFIRSHPATEATPAEVIPAADGGVELQGFVLPHKDQLSEQDALKGGGTQGWAAQQGFYVYRGGRLLVAGGWLGLGTPRPWTMEEPFRLARLRVEFGNRSDATWDIDVKKSTARPPRQLRLRMTALAEIVRGKARDVFAHRGSYGKRESVTDLEATWLTGSASTTARYRINRRHPLVAAALETPADRATIEAALQLIELSVPVERIWLDTAERGEVSDRAVVAEAPPELADIGRSLVAHWTGRLGMTSDEARRRLLSTDPFHSYPALVEGLVMNANVTKAGQ
ncbi:MAG: ATP-binding protein [Hyphomicrobium sp.]|nr:MAG: ATP-binding protein [Hyphomicrobium sp.]